jgi:hypothetical protein
MIKTCLLASVVIAAAAGAAHASPEAGSFGLGAEFQLSGLGGVSGTYDAGAFHAGLALGLADKDAAGDTVFQVAGRFFWHVAGSAQADFSLGGSVGLETVTIPAMAMMNSTTDVNVYIEPGFQIRAFIVPHVALSFTGGISIGVAHDSTVVITGQGLDGEAGVTYYF